MDLYLKNRLDPVDQEAGSVDVSLDLSARDNEGLIHEDVPIALKNVVMKDEVQKTIFVFECSEAGAFRVRWTLPHNHQSRNFENTANGYCAYKSCCRARNLFE